MVTSSYVFLIAFPPGSQSDKCHLGLLPPVLCDRIEYFHMDRDASEASPLGSCFSRNFIWGELEWEGLRVKQRPGGQWPDQRNANQRNRTTWEGW